MHAFKGMKGLSYGNFKQACISNTSKVDPVKVKKRKCRIRKKEKRKLIGRILLVVLINFSLRIFFGYPLDFRQPFFISIL